jgi:hypothetical protein
MTVDGTCQNCKFWEGNNGPEEFGECRYDAPRIAVTSGVPDEPYFGWWPRTHQDEWCGRWMAVPELAE